MRGASHAKPRKGIYEQRVLAYLDVLGWSQLVRRSDRDRRVLQPVIEALEWMQRVKRTAAAAKVARRMERAPTKTVPHEVAQFSDCVAISCSPDPTSIQSVLYMVQQFTNRLLLHCDPVVYVRGAIVVGSLFHRDNIILGPALVDAYHLERASVDTQNRPLMDT